MIPAGVRRFFFRILPFAFALCTCFAQDAPVGRGLLPPPPTSVQEAAGTAPQKPFSQLPGAQAFSRSVYLEPSGPANVKVEVVDAVIPPGQSAQMPAAGGPVMIDLRSGAGTVVAGATTSTLSLQKPVSVAAGTQFAIKNSGPAPLMLRLYELGDH